LRDAIGFLVGFGEVTRRPSSESVPSGLLRHRGGQHKDIGVYDRITWDFVRYIHGYRRQMAPRVRRLIAGIAQVIVLRRRRAARDYLAVVSLQASRSARAVYDQ
jgi:hypothetical protein